MKLRWTDPEERRRRVENMKRTLADPAVRQRRSDIHKRRWADPATREAMRLAFANPTARERHREAIKRSWADPTVRQKRIENSKRALADPVVRQRQRDNWKLALTDPDVQRRISEAQKRSWVNNPARRQQTSTRFKRMWAERRSRLAAALPVDWRKKTMLWRIIGMELLTQNYLSNMELALRLDSSRVLKCPYGETWIASVNAKGFLEFTRKIRLWVGRRGRIRGKAH